MYDFKVVQGSLHEGSDRFQQALTSAVDDGYELVHVVGVEGAVWAVMRKARPVEPIVH